MAGTANMAFGGLSNGFNHVPRHIPVKTGEEPQHTGEAPLSGYMIDPRYLRRPNEHGAQHGAAQQEALPAAETTLAGAAVPALTSQSAAERRAAADEASAEYEVVGHDWRRVVFPVAALLFIAALGFADLAFREPNSSNKTAQNPSQSHQTATSPTASPSPPSSASPSPSPSSQLGTGSSPSPSASLSPSPSATPQTGTSTPLIGGRGGGGPAPSPTPAPSTSSGPASSQPTLSPSTTNNAQQPSSSTPTTGGLGGGSPASIAPEPGLPTPPLLPGK